MGVVHLGFGLAVVASMSILIKRPLYIEQIQVLGMHEYMYF
jgi:hypothetical protein